MNSKPIFEIIGGVERKEPIPLPELGKDNLHTKIGNHPILPDDYCKGFNSLYDTLKDKRVGLDLDKIKKLCDNYFSIEYYKKRAEDSGLDSDKAIYEERKSNARTLANALCQAADQIIVEMKDNGKT